ncbi:MAG: MBL fold metallo-hydrolase [Candidatus Hydrogenedentes bacterium]|nr:MBL fold metallo-hydrolase [Candidatus Hydrogenedentota bacterium]
MRISTAAVMSVVLVRSVAAGAQDPGEALWRGLQENPPTAPQTAERIEALKALDTWLAEPDSEKNEAVVAYYQRAVDHAFDCIEREKPGKGVRVFQLYSSSVIVQTPDTVFAIDLDQGPNKRLDQAASEEGVAFRMREDQIARLARLVDVSFHTHEHYDHVDFAITRALIEAGKTVVVTESNKALWAEQPWAEKLVVLDQTLDEPHELGGLTVDVLHDHQWDNETHTRGTPCNAFLIATADGTCVGTKGDINCGLRLYGWLNVMVERGRHVDVMVGSPIYWRGANLMREIDALLAPVWAAGHVWEFTHRSAGERGGATGTYARNSLGVAHAIEAGEACALSWGEHLDIEPARKASRARKRK